MPNANTVREVMTKDLECLPQTASIAQAARAMRDSNIGVVLVNDNSEILKGLVTDRDIVVRAIADGQNPNDTPVGRICSNAEYTITPDAPIERAVEIMREAAVRRIPVVEDGRAVGIVSLGDLAIEREPKSVLGKISSAPSNN